ncbi:MAG: hypothetical protein IPJ50_16525 [Betaproteobacteria bacterium]|nr:hypothetical protein [Betaproteobacteria bacterium]
MIERIREPHFPLRMLQESTTNGANYANSMTKPRGKFVILVAMPISPAIFQGVFTFACQLRKEKLLWGMLATS